MIKDCNSCIHNRGGINCGLKSKYNDYKLEMEQLIEKWGESNGFGFSLDCPSWYEEPNGKQVKHYTNPLSNNDKGRPNDWVEKDKNKVFKAEDIKIKPVSIKFDNGSEIKTIPCDNTTVRSRRSEEYPKYIPYEKYENTEDLFKAIMKTLFN
ncbi:hypothetical protein [uncultured Clostridium sp.]|uniref:hypothetical protein n=1 Tax=uncultured Clostridium sp. TaxID=59620 RepID=UPI003217835E